VNELKLTFIYEQTNTTTHWNMGSCLCQ